nr:MAG TPA: hypothetical protein [Caudoviricetes sp.]DAT63802.1 MAG TPA: hypothetical protein [Caudoviricetes sp.]
MGWYGFFIVLNERRSSCRCSFSVHPSALLFNAIRIL